MNRRTKRELEMACMRGAFYLDKINPDWFRNIDTHFFHLAGNFSCILAQSFNSNFPDVVQELNLTNKQIRNYGFGEMTRGELRYMEKIWLDSIEDREIVG